ncbi:hypothetical protein K474DRAFT_1695572 [Panus rudis PR-1116 ss-1]|nr:hypothetical protein K474DRAFT_1695572 [Panus rudis PR-1116 ss-1]
MSFDVPHTLAESTSSRKRKKQGVDPAVSEHGETVTKSSKKKSKTKGELDDNASHSTKEKKKRKRKDPDVTADTDKKEKKRRKKETEGVKDDVDVEMQEDIDEDGVKDKERKKEKEKKEKKEKKKSKHKKVDAEAEERSFHVASDSVPGPSHLSEDLPSKKRKEKKKSVEEPKNPEEPSNKKLKKEKRKKSNDDAVTSTSKGSDDRSPDKGKHKAKKTANPEDPDEDQSLGEQARKALSYAYSYVHNRSEWKFNKARQNWLIRNIWSQESIPDNHVSIANKYLESIQGGVREAFIKTCRETLTVPTSQPEQSTTTSTDASAPIDESASKTPSIVTDSIKQTRARDLLAILTEEES